MGDSTLDPLVDWRVCADAWTRSSDPELRTAGRRILALLRILDMTERRVREEARAWSAVCVRADAAEARVAAGLAVLGEHRDFLTRRGLFPQRGNDCVCLGCQTYRALTGEQP